MSAPDKIYLQACGSCDLDKETCENCEFAKLLEGGEVTWSEDKIFERDVEYIRKDYLLELIEEEEKFWDDGKMIFRGLKKELNEL